MNTKTLRHWLAAGAVIATTLASVPAHAGPFSDLFIFGDSLSDTGNTNLLTGGAVPTPGTGPYFGGRFSNGPLWVETLAAGLGLASAADSFQTGGNNYAFAGARTGLDVAPPGLVVQGAFLWGSTHPVADANALYVVVAGGNDMRDARDLFTTNSQADQDGRQAAAVSAFNNIAFTLSYLATAGAKNVLIADLPDLGATPEAIRLGLQGASTDASQRFNALIPFLLSFSTQNLGLNVSFLDLAALSQAVIADAVGNNGLTYGITNVTSACAGFTFSAGDACASSLFSDELHPSARAHALIGEAALLSVGVVPEPSTVVLFALGLAGIIGWNRRRQA